MTIFQSVIVFSCCFSFQLRLARREFVGELLVCFRQFIFLQ